MPVDVEAATSFMATHARILDRLRLRLLLHGTEPASVLAALAAYRNPDGGYGWGLEPDLRAAGSQPVCAMHALEILAECGPAGEPEAVRLCAWLQAHTLDDGGMPMALPVDDPAGCAPVWTGADTSRSSLQMTAQLAARAQRLAAQHAAVREHPWTARATRYCLDAIGAVGPAPHAYELLFSVQFLDAAAAAGTLGVDAPLDRLARAVPPDGAVPVEGGTDGETLHLLDLSPHPESRSRRLFAEQAVESDLDRLAAQQRPDGGWEVDYPLSSPAAALEWRGYATVHAVEILLRHGRVHARRRGQG